jgi:hypothetical protein
MADDSLAAYRYYSGRRVATGSLNSRVYRVMLFDRGETAFDPERLFDRIGISRERIGGNLRRAENAAAQIGEEGPTVFARALANTVRDDRFAGGGERKGTRIGRQNRPGRLALGAAVFWRRNSRLRQARSARHASRASWHRAGPRSRCRRGRQGSEWYRD